MIGLGTTAVGVVGDVASKILGATEMPRTVEKIEEPEDVPEEPMMEEPVAEKKPKEGLMARMEE